VVQFAVIDRGCRKRWQQDFSVVSDLPTVRAYVRRGGDGPTDAGGPICGV